MEKNILGHTNDTNTRVPKPRS